jgi:hypothetical protein
MAATVVAAIEDSGDFLCEAAHYSDSLLAQTLIRLRHGLQGYGIGVCFVASNAKRKEKKEVLGTSSNELLKGKFHSLHEDLKAQPQTFL